MNDDQGQPGLIELLHSAGAAFRDLSAAVNRVGAVDAEQLQIEGDRPVIRVAAERADWPPRLGR